MLRITRPAVIGIAAVLLAAGTPAARANAVDPGGNFLELRSEPGDYVGQGLNQSMNNGTHEFQVLFTPERLFVQLNPHNPNGPVWTVVVEAPRGASLGAGTYLNARRAFTGDTALPGLSVYGDGRGCNEITGSFTIDTFVLDDLGIIDQLDLSYEQHCDAATAALRGTLSLRQPAPPEPGVAIPTSGTFLHLNSQDGDWVGRGEEQLLTAPPLTASVQEFGSRLQFGLSGPSDWWMVWVSAPHDSTLHTGTYTRAGTVATPTAPGLSISGNGFGCSESMSNFSILELRRDSEGVVAFEMTFEQHCDRSMPALYGRFRFERPHVDRPPVLTMPTDTTIEATGPRGAIYRYSATATDDHGTPLVRCRPPSGRWFPLGTTTIACTATDQAGNSTRGTTAVTVLPRLQLRASIDPLYWHPTPRVVSVHVRVTCTRVMAVTTKVTARQVTPSGATLTGESTVNATCGPSPTELTLDVVASSGRFSRRSTAVTAVVSGCELSCHEIRVTRTAVPN